MKMRSNSRWASSKRMPRSIICWTSAARSSRIIGSSRALDREVAAGQAPVGFEIFLARARDDVVGQRRHGRLLVPADLLRDGRGRTACRSSAGAWPGCVAGPSARSATSPASAPRRSARSSSPARPNSNFVSAMMMPRVVGVRRRRARRCSSVRSRSRAIRSCPTMSPACGLADVLVVARSRPWSPA